MVERASDVSHAALQAEAHGSGLICFGEDGVERRVDMAIGHAASAQFARDAKASLFAQLRMLSRVVERVAIVIEVLLFAQPRRLPAK